MEDMAKKKTNPLEKKEKKMTHNQIKSATVRDGGSQQRKIQKHDKQKPAKTQGKTNPMYKQCKFDTHGFSVCVCVMGTLSLEKKNTFENQLVRMIKC